MFFLFLSLTLCPLATLATLLVPKLIQHIPTSYHLPLLGPPPQDWLPQISTRFVPRLPFWPLQCHFLRTGFTAHLNIVSTPVTPFSLPFS